MPPQICIYHDASFRGASKQTGGFSLIELLMVVALMAILLVASVSAFNSLSQSRSIAQGIYQVAGILELARNEAVTKQTYTRVSFQQVTNNGRSEVLMAAVRSLDGSGTNVAPANLREITRVVRFPSAQLTSWGQLMPATREAGDTMLGRTVSPISLANVAGALSFKVGTTDFSGPSITFTPRGEAIAAPVVDTTTGYSDYLDISFRQTRGLTESSDEAAVLLDGATGALLVVRR